jgi:hypothetical protein
MSKYIYPCRKKYLPAKGKFKAGMESVVIDSIFSSKCGLHIM